MSEALRRTRELVASSSPSGWAAEDPESIVRHLDEALAALEAGTPVDRARLRLLFAPTGAIQEISIDNGWGDDFVELSGVVDAFLAEAEE